MNVSFSQSIEERRAFQFDKVVSQMTGGGEFLISIGLSYNPSSQRVYILKRTKDSFFVASYGGRVNNYIGDVYFLSVNDDTLFTKTVDTIYSDIKQNHSYKAYSKGILNGGYFFLTFYENSKLQIFANYGASQNLLTKVEFVINRLNGLSVAPFSGYNRRIKYLHVQNFNDLLKYLKSNSVDSLVK
jgi:hypothetical protein